ncbi:MAG: hypothetical protein EX272_12415 [Chromatiales bacterium]|nr:MAG: hypothetical protein EX272_12415 [Chromatiales bacterium]
MVIRNSLKKSTQFIVLTVFLVFSSFVAAEQEAFEDAADLRAKDVLPKDLRKGAHHRVEKVVRNDGYLNYYTITSDYGEFEAVSTAMLKTRVGEINALAELDDLSKTEVFIKAAADAGVGQLKTLKQFATKPVETVVGIPSGVGRMFKRYSRQAGEAVDATKEFVAGDDEEETQAEGEEGDSESTTDKAVDLTESFFGVSGSQRAWAQKLGTDPYSSNEVLQAAIKEVAWAERLGRFGMGFAGVPEIPGADIIGEVNDAVWSKDPYELQDLNRARLAATGADDELIESYLENSRMSPSQQTLLTAAIAEIDGASGRDGILRQALNAETEAEANFLIKSVTMLAWYHLTQSPVVAVSTYAAVPSGTTEDGARVLVFAVDHVYWTETIAEAAGKHAAQSNEDGASKATVWLLGTASRRTADELARLGLEVHENVATMMVAPAG